MRYTLFPVLKMEAKMDQLRALVEAADKDKVDLVNQLEEERRLASQVKLALLSNKDRHLSDMLKA